MNPIAWYKKRMADPALDTKTYLEYWNIVRELEASANRTYQEGMERIIAREKEKA